MASYDHPFTDPVDVTRKFHRAIIVPYSSIENLFATIYLRTILKQFRFIELQK